MAGPLLVGAEGVVLIPDHQDFGASRPLMDGLQLVSILKQHPTTRTVIIGGLEDEKLLDTWCKIHGLKGVGVVGIPAVDRHVDPALAQWYAIERERALGPINMVLTAWQSVYQRCTMSHQRVLLFGRVGAVGSNDNLPAFKQMHDQVMRTREAEIDDDEDE